MKQLDRLEKKITAAGIPTRRSELVTSCGPVPVLIALHDYMGPYPTKEALHKAETIRRICSRSHVRVQMRGYYQASYIWEEVAPA